MGDFDNAFSQISDRTQAYIDNENGFIKAQGENSYNPGKHLEIQKPAYKFFPHIVNPFLNKELFDYISLFF